MVAADACLYPINIFFNVYHKKIVDKHISTCYNDSILTKEESIMEQIAKTSKLIKKILDILFWVAAAVGIIALIVQLQC